MEGEVAGGRGGGSIAFGRQLSGGQGDGEEERVMEELQWTPRPTVCLLLNHHRTQDTLFITDVHMLMLIQAL